MFYVTMTDKFMSGWGMAQGKINKLVLECETYEDAETVYNNACNRSEMFRQIVGEILTSPALFVEPRIFHHSSVPRFSG